MGRGLLLRGQPSLHPKGAGSQRSPILGVPFYLCVHPLTQNYQISRGITFGKGLVLRWSVTPHFKGAGSQRCPILGFLSIYVYTLCRRTTIFDVVTHVGCNMCILGSATPPIPRERSFSAPQCWGYVFIHTSFNTERPNSAW